MSFQAILDAIIAEGDGRIRQIEEQAQNRAEALLQQAQVEGEAQRDRLIAMYHMRGLREQVLHLQQANQHCTLILGKAYEELVEAALKRVAECLKTVRRDPVYGDVLARLVDEAIDLLRLTQQPGETVVLQADPADHALLSALTKDISVEYTLDCLGGIVARSEDGRIVVINTLEARLEQATPFLRRQMARSLARAFEQR